MLAAMNKRVERFLPLIVTLCVVVGYLDSEFWSGLAFLIPYVFAVMTFIGSMNATIRDVRHVVTHPLPLFACIVLLHGAAPVMAWAAGSLVFHDAAAVIAGIVLVFVVPTGVMSLVWVMIIKGNIAFTLTLIVVDTLLAPLYIPLVLKWILGGSVDIDMLDMMGGLFLMILLPSLAGLLFNHWTRGEFKKKYGQGLSLASKLGTMLVITPNSAVVAPSLKGFGPDVLAILLVIFALANANYWLGFGVARLFRWDPGLTTSVVLNSGLRNNAAASALALAYFPPQAAISPIVFFFFQQVLASFYVRWLDRRSRRLAGAEPDPASEAASGGS